MLAVFITGEVYCVNIFDGEAIVGKKNILEN